MNKQQRQLYDQRLIAEPTQATKGRFKRTCEPFVLDYGLWYNPPPLAGGIEIDTPQQCHQTGRRMTCGFAVFGSGRQVEITTTKHKLQITDRCTSRRHRN